MIAPVPSRCMRVPLLCSGFLGNTSVTCVAVLLNDMTLAW